MTLIHAGNCIFIACENRQIVSVGHEVVQERDDFAVLAYYEDVVVMRILLNLDLRGFQCVCSVC